MTKYLVIGCFLLIVVCIGEYFYFQQQLMTWQANAEGWRRTAYDAEQALDPLKIQLKNCEARPDATQLTQELIECRNRCPKTTQEIEEIPLLEEKYASWPEFLHPDSSGHIPVIQQYLRSNIKDLNALKIMQYGEVFREAKLYVLDVKVRGRSDDGQYRINTYTFKFFEDGRVYDVKEDIGVAY